jgi:hypothetical protein
MAGSSLSLLVSEDFGVRAIIFPVRPSREFTAQVAEIKPFLAMIHRRTDRIPCYFP